MLSKKIISRTCLGLALLTSTAFYMPQTVLAAENETSIQSEVDINNYDISNELIQKADPYVKLTDNGFYLEGNAKKILNETELKIVENHITLANENINSLGDNFIKENNYASVLYTNDNNPILSRANFKEGITKVEFHWWGLQVYASKSYINACGGAMSIGTVYIPEPVVTKIVATLGGVMGMCPGGIKFKYSFAKAGISVFVPGSPLFLSGITDIGFQ